MYIHEVPMFAAPVEAGIWRTRQAIADATFGISELVNRGPKDPFHDLLEVHYGCEGCGQRFVRTYELSSKGKANRDGRYTRIFKTTKESGETFKGMRDDYAVVNHNCGHWARQMFTKLIDPAVDNDMRIRQETEKLKKALFNFTNFP
ncbi:hypothetical protein AAVH_26833 [Aphelenchoides avenae]|nr:hypothetical protein AAVH_26833 [Aphelenchus avenae]